MQNWETIFRVCQPSMVPDILLPYQGEKPSSEDSTNNTSVENPTTIPTGTGTFGGLPLEDSPTTRPGINDNIV